MKFVDKIKGLTNRELIQLSDELRIPTITENSLIMKVINDTEFNTKTPMFTLMGVGMLVGFELADRLKMILDHTYKSSI